MKLCSVLTVLFWLLSVTILPAQSDLQFEHLSVEDGLSQSTVLSIGQDKEGFMWFGTEYGLNKYDGYSFKVFQANPKASAYTLNHLIRDIYEDRRGRLWVGANGLNLLNKRTDTFKAFLVDSTRFTYLNICLAILEDEQGRLWFSAGVG